jgi:ArsR family transcriptional regulator, arsenate/arsenite/antimonite-responsive transcriptional repressor
VREVMAVLKALADETRLRIFLALSGGELCVCQIVELTRLAPSTVSKHMAILNQARLVDGRKEGRWMFYRLAGKDTTAAARRIAALIPELLVSDASIREDAKRLKQITKMDKEALCQKQNRC